MRVIEAALVAVGLLGAVLGVAEYMRQHPWRTDIGRHLLSYMGAVLALYALVTAGLIFGRYTGRVAVTDAVAVGLDGVVWWRWWLVRRARRQPAGTREGER